MKTINVENFEVGGDKAYIIADIGSNHKQDLNLAKETIDAAIEAGVNAVKFQSIQMQELYFNPSKKNAEFVRKLEFPEEWHGILNDYCRSKGIVFFSSPTYLKSIDLLEEINVPIYKLASAQVGTFPQLIERVAQLNKPTIFSTGISNFDEVNKSVEIFEKNGNNKYIILHCNSIYPTPANRVNLQLINSYKNMFNHPVGFSDHTIGTHISCAAITMGANVIEKHFTIDRNLDTPDSNEFASDPYELKLLVNQIREVEMAVNKVKERTTIENEELDFKNQILYKCFVNKELKIGDTLKSTDIQYLRTEGGIDATSFYNDCRRKIIVKHMNTGDLLTESHLRYE